MFITDTVCQTLQVWYKEGSDLRCGRGNLLKMEMWDKIGIKSPHCEWNYYQEGDAELIIFLFHIDFKRNIGLPNFSGNLWWASLQFHQLITLQQRSKHLFWCTVWTGGVLLSQKYFHKDIRKVVCIWGDGFVVDILKDWANSGMW